MFAQNHPAKLVDGFESYDGRGLCRLVRCAHKSVCQNGHHERPTQQPDHLNNQTDHADGRGDANERCFALQFLPQKNVSGQKRKPGDGKGKPSPNQARAPCVELGEDARRVLPQNIGVLKDDGEHGVGDEKGDCPGDE